MTDTSKNTKFHCRICNADDSNPTYIVREMMYGTREEFEYFHCKSCGCLQISNIPQDLARHYPLNYYSQLERVEPSQLSGLKGIIMQWYCRSATLHPDRMLTNMVRSKLPMPTDFAEYGHYLIDAKLLNHTDRILDVGSGASPHRLAAFLRCGFGGVEGIDPYITADTQYHGVPIYRRTIEQMQGKYGLIMFHHSLEHVPDPLETLKTAAKILRPGGTCLIRIPVMGTYFWRTFGVNWVELDAPRHLYILEQRTIQILAQKAGLRVYKTVFDSQGWEISSSLKYQAGIPQRGPDTGENLVEQNTMFTNEQLQAFELQAQELNACGDGGRACFYLEKIIDDSITN